MDFLSDLIARHPAETGLTVAALIVVFGLLVYGLRDLLRFGPRRVWALSGVVFRESIRRKVLWLTPLAMLGVVVLTGLQRPEDESDAIRQTIQFCLFASGLLVVVSGVMLSCTNLPKDIESKVVFTIVTKPTTRFEIVLGKVLGFARVTGMIVLLMGLFTWGYCHARAWQLGHDVSRKLAGALDNEFARNRLEHYRSAGLLATRTLAVTQGYQVLAQLPGPDDKVRWISTRENALIPFDVEPDELRPAGDFKDEKGSRVEIGPGQAGLYLDIRLSSRQIGKAAREQPEFQAPLLAPAADENPYGEPSVTISFIDRPTGTVLLASSEFNNNRPLVIKPEANGKVLRLPIQPRLAPALAGSKQWAVQISPANSNYLIGVNPGDVTLLVPGKEKNDERKYGPVKLPGRDEVAALFRGNNTANGLALAGPEDQRRSFAIYHFDGPEPVAVDDKVDVELAFGLERLDADSTELSTQARVTVINPSAGQPAAPVILTPEMRRDVYAQFPADAFAGGRFDVVVETLTPGHAVTLANDSVMIVGHRDSFTFNVAKAFFSQWMLSVLVVTIGLFCSTFVSWPIAIVLSLVMLTGRWVVSQLSDSLQPGIGAMIATDIGATDASQARVISATFDGLARMLNVVAEFLPNIDRFSTAEQLERGLTIVPSTLAGAAIVLAVFGLPLLVLAYVVLRNKEVAP